MRWPQKITFVTLAGLTVLLGMWFGTSYNMTVSFLMSCLVAGLLLWALPRKKESNEIVLAEGVTQADLDSAVETCRQAGRQFMELSTQIEVPAMSTMVTQIGDSCLNIADNFIQDPKDLLMAKDFIYHLNRAVVLIAGYTQQCKQSHLSDDERTVLQQTEEQIAYIRDAFQTHLRNFRADNIRELSISGKALSDILRLEVPINTIKRRN